MLDKVGYVGLTGSATLEARLSLLNVKFLADASYVPTNDSTLNNSESIVEKLKGQIIDITV